MYIYQCQFINKYIYLYINRFCCQKKYRSTKHMKNKKTSPFKICRNSKSLYTGTIMERLHIELWQFILYVNNFSKKYFNAEKTRRDCMISKGAEIRLKRRLFEVIMYIIYV